MHEILIRTGEAPALEAALSRRLQDYNAAATGYHDAGAFSACVPGASGELEAGISGYTWGGCCVVEYLWVSEAARGRGIGSALLAAAEQHAQAVRCGRVILASHTFQAPAFYAGRGYVPVARVEDYPVGHADVWFVKRLGR
jgi:GNAT superfamily N-acetyltransferase